MSQEIHTTAKELQSKQKPPEAVHQEMKPVETAFVHPSGINQNLPTLSNSLSSMPTMSTNRTDDAFQDTTMACKLNFNHSVQAMQQSYNQSTQSLQHSYNNTAQAIQQAYFAYLNSNKN